MHKATVEYCMANTHVQLKPHKWPNTALHLKSGELQCSLKQMAKANVSRELPGELLGSSTLLLFCND